MGVSKHLTALAVFLFAFPALQSFASATEWIYSDAVQPGWNTSGSYDVSVYPSAVTPSPHSGQYSLQATYEAPWGAVHFENTTGGVIGDIGGSVTVWFYKYDTGGAPLSSDVEIALFDTSGNLIGTADVRYYANSLSANTWHEVTVPLADLNAEGATIDAVELQSENLLLMFYDDLVVHEGSGSPPPADPSPSVYDEGFGTAWDGWMWYGTNVDFSSTNVPAYSGNVSTRVRYEQANDSLEFAASGGFDTTNFNTLSFAIHGGANGGQSITVMLLDENENVMGSHTLTDPILAGVWNTFSLPLSLLGGTNTEVFYVDFQSAATTLDMYYDDVRFETVDGGSSGGCSASQAAASSSSIYGIGGMSGMQSGGSCFPISGPFIYYFSDRKAPDTDRWVWGVADAEVPNNPFSGNKALRFILEQNPSGGSGVQFHSETSFDPNGNIGNQYIVFAVRGDAGIQDASVTLIAVGQNGGTPTGNSVSVAGYLAGGSIEQNWNVAVIPLSDLIAFPFPTSLTGFSVDFIGSGMVFLDEVRIAGIANPNGFLELPVHNGSTPYTVTISSVFDHQNTNGMNCADGVVVAYTGERGAINQSQFSTTNSQYCSQGTSVLHGWSQEGLVPFSLGGQYDTTPGYPNGNESGIFLFYDGHTGYDYFGTDFTDVYSAASGTVYSFDTVYNEIAIKHGNGYYTFYTHLANVNPGLSVGDPVTTSTKLGSTGNLLLHFTVKKMVGGSLKRVDPYGWLGTSGQDPWQVNGQDNTCLWLTCK